MREHGFPAYTTSVGWLGYSEAKLRRLCREGIARGLSHFKIQLGASVGDDTRRTQIVRDEIGEYRKLMMDANQVWDGGQTIASMQRLAAFEP
ncbi:enolase C-terminal domain-like protein [Sorangium sp. So ce1036]|uniref:enolase C-terminal domain-like protein n=1 Tax=Sorangium sp. So ce1036 TaxID=3133328 RepID=UPI003F104088